MTRFAYLHDYNLMKDRILDFYSPKNALVDAHIFVASVSFFVTCETRTHLLQKEEFRNPWPLSVVTRDNH